MPIDVQEFEKMEQANRIFTDREEPRKAFWDKYKTYKDNMEMNRKNTISILTYYGIGGIGKSTLLHKIQQEIEDYRLKEGKKKEIPYVYYDLKADSSKRAVLEGLRKLLENNYNFTFPIFDLAQKIYRLKVGMSIDRAEHEGIISKNQYVGVATDIAGAGIDIINAVPMAGPLAVATLKIIDTLIANQRNKSETRKLELSKLQDDSPDEILSNLQLNFAKDLTENLKGAKYPLVIFFDTYEMLVNEQSIVGEPLMNDSWLHDLKNGLVTHVPNVIWVFAGREKIKWDHLNRDWADNLEQHLIGNLSEVDVKQFLSASSIKSLPIQEMIYEITKGVPVYLDICCNNYFYLIQNKIPVSRERLGEDEKTLIERFMRYTDDTLKDILYLISCLDSWTEEALYDIVSSVRNNVPVSSIEKIKGLSFVESDDGKNYHMHQIVKEVLYKKCHQNIKEQTSKYFDHAILLKLTDADVTSIEFIQLLRKSISIKSELIKNEDDFENFYQQILNKYIKPLTDTFQYDSICQIYDFFLKKNDFYINNSMTAAEIYSDYAKQLIKAGKYDAAEYYGENAYRITRESLGEGTLKGALLLNQLGKICFHQGKYNKGIQITEKAAKIISEIMGEEDPCTIEIMYNLSISYSRGNRVKG